MKSSVTVVLDKTGYHDKMESSVTVVKDKPAYHDKMDALVYDKQTYEELNLNVTRLLHFNANLIAHYWQSRRQTSSTPDATDWDAQYHNHRNFAVCRNYTKLVSWYVLLVPSVDIPTVQVPDDNSGTADRQIQTLTTIHRGGRYNNS